MPKDQEEPKLPLQHVVLLIAAVAGGLWLYQGPLKSSRPVQDLTPPDSSGALDDRVPARLWQDPFEAVEQFDKRERSGVWHRTWPAKLRDGPFK
jgi:hypothetical protein